ncbi:MAG TPA: hypothetical protein VF221_13050, partial [Chloroflexota bacterium]
MYGSSSTPAVPAAEDTRRSSRLRTTRLGAAAAIRSPWTPAAIVWLAYGLWLASAFHGGHSARDFIVIGRRFVTQSHVSSVIRLDPHYDYAPYGAGY